MQLVVLDRDGVINQDSEHYIKSPAEWIALPGSLNAIARLNQAGFNVVIATNQSGLARGLFSLDDLNAIHQTMREALAQIGGHVDGIFFCPHAPNTGCLCRKPAPGLLWQIRDWAGVTLQQVPVIGDSLRDIESAKAAGAVPVLVETGNGKWTQLHHAPALENVRVFVNLAAAAESMISGEFYHRNVT